MHKNQWQVFAGVSFFLIVIIFGTAGYVLIENASLLDALYMTVITVSTVGFGEVIPLSPAGRILTIFVVLFGTGTAAYTATQFLNYIIAGEIRRTFGRRRMEKRIQDLSGHYIICGFGRMGRVIAGELNRKGIPFVVVDGKDSLSEEMEMLRFHFLHGDATREEALVRAGIERAKGLISVVDTDMANVYIVLTARGFNKDLYIMAKCSADEAQTKLKWAGANKVISPYTTGAHSIANAILKPNVSEFLELALGSGDYNIEVEEFPIEEGSFFHGKKIMESNIRTFGIIIIAIRKASGAFFYNPGPETLMNSGDTLIVLGRHEDFLNLKKTHGRGKNVVV